MKTDQTQPHKFRRRLGFSTAAVCLFLTVALGSEASHASLPGAEVGKVTLVLGKAWLITPGSGRVPVKQGMGIGVHDKVDTAADGHVHIRFVDNALVSVRPYSSLEIQRYDYDSANPAASAIKLNLLEGETRAISGEAAQKARQNFRMNTPVAAIGVRGTDFVANADGGQVEARINEGAIIVAPFSTECLPDALGPCSTNSYELAFNYGASQILQVGSTGDVALLPISSSGLPESIVDQSLVQPEPQVVARATGSDEKRDGGELYAESVAALAVNPRLVATRPSPPVAPAPGPDPEPVIPPEFTPDVALSAQTLKSSQLIWGRWYEPAQEYERITVDFATALEGRKGAMSNDNYVLFREMTLARVQPNLGVVNFGLNSAQTMYRTNGGVELLDVNGGTLNIDFNQSTFATSLIMRGALAGTVDFSASGALLDGGFFNMVSPSQEMAGAVSFDGNEAGYFFEKMLEGGTIEGLTLWGRRP